MDEWSFCDMAEVTAQGKKNRVGKESLHEENKFFFCLLSF